MNDRAVSIVALAILAAVVLACCYVFVFPPVW